MTLLALAIATILAVMDVSVANIILAVITLIGIITPIYFKYKTDALNKKAELLDKKADDIDKKTVVLDVKIKEVEKATNGMQSALLLSGARASRAEGEIAGRERQKLEDLRQPAAQAPVASVESANVAKVAEIIHAVDKNVRAVDKKVEVIDGNVQEVHEAVVKQSENQTK